MIILTAGAILFIAFISVCNQGNQPESVSSAAKAGVKITNVDGFLFI
jgi:hypothetical protein